MARTRISKNIYYDSNKKRYYVKFYYGKNEQGRYITKYKTVKTKKEAERQLTAFLYGKDTNTITSPSEHTVETWLEYWMKHAVEPNSQETTIYGYRQIMKNHIIPALGKVKLQKLTADQLQQYYTTKLKTLSPNTVLKHHNLMQTAFVMAERHDIITRSPTFRATPPRAIQNEIRPLTAEQLQKLIEAAYENKEDKHALLLTIIFAAFTGMRREEILGLTWGDVDIKKGLITIRKARTSAGSKIVSKKTKTASSVRVISMSDRLKVELIKAQVNYLVMRTPEGGKASKRIDSSSYIIVNDKGDPCRPNYMSMVFRKLADKCGFVDITLHGLRHTFASLANAQGHTMFDISKLLGHSRPDITGKIYTHMFETADEKLIASISTSIEGGLSKKLSNTELIADALGQMEQRVKEQEQDIEARKQEVEARKAEIDEYKRKIEQATAGSKTQKKINAKMEGEVESLQEEYKKLLNEH